MALFRSCPLGWTLVTLLLACTPPHVPPTADPTAPSTGQTEKKASDSPAGEKNNTDNAASENQNSTEPEIPPPPPPPQLEHLGEAGASEAAAAATGEHQTEPPSPLVPLTASQSDPTTSGPTPLEFGTASPGMQSRGTRSPRARPQSQRKDGPKPLSAHSVTTRTRSGVSQTSTASPKLSPLEHKLRAQFIGQRIPDLESLVRVRPLTGLDEWRDFRGKVLLIEFWASWCGSCRRMIPAMNRFHRNPRLRVMGISIESPQVVATSSLLGMTYPLFHDPDAQVTRAFRVNSLPSIFVVDDRGIIRDLVIGSGKTRVKRLEAAIQALGAG